MSRQLTFTAQAEIDAYLERIRQSAEWTQAHIRQLVAIEKPLDFLHQMKFKESGCDPLDLTRRLNLIEQLNQAFTYVASLKAASYLLRCRPPFSTLTLNLGNISGWDIESDENGGLVAEVFAAVSPQNNRKLDKDIKKVAEKKAQHRYVFFMCPDIEAGSYRGMFFPRGVKVVSLGCNML